MDRGQVSQVTPPEMQEGAAGIVLMITDQWGRRFVTQAVFNDLDLLAQDPMGGVKKALVGVTKEAIRNIVEGNMFNVRGKL